MHLCSIFRSQGRALSTQAFINAKIFTGRSESDFAEAFTVGEGVIQWVGRTAELDEEARASAVDMGGRTVLPGLLDMHVHPALMANTADAVECLPPRVRSIAELVEALRTHPAHGAGGDAWIIGAGYDETKYPDGDPAAVDLDRVSTDQPVLVWRADRHTALCNTRALELAGVTAQTPDPEGGRFGRHPDGTPNGLLEEFAAISAVTASIPDRTPVERADLLEQVGRRLFSRGIVGVCDLLATTMPDPLGAYRTVSDRTSFPQAALFYGWSRPEPLSNYLPMLTEEQKTGPQRIAGVKVLMDGAYSNRTAWVCQPYPGSAEHGIRTISDEDLFAAADWTRRNGVQLAVHAMGDRAIAHVVDLFEEAEPWMEGAPSIRIEHATLMSPELVARMQRARMTFGIATHTIFLYSEYEAYESNLRPELVPDAYPIGSLYGSVEALALSSDCPATAWSEADDVFVSIEAAVRRRSYTGEDIGQGSAITVPQAVLLYTARAAQLTQLDGLGQLVPGHRASFVVLTEDIFTVAEDRISQVQAAETWADGEQVYQAGDSPERLRP